ncbi:hypothetical protein [Saccharothrix violaceirubra]|uniref:Uncharacterized protein n=1 Tax=Saccharothrix violaceirubra TaxID=413306 RepID=A0A7W7SZX3_9PSEU|nr:hypothetical protein [Saccharothrix violaceirubra]MBB4963746.1 hypothetical protein [Saccharothrix violaceirubra]
MNNTALLARIARVAGHPALTATTPDLGRIGNITGTAKRVDIQLGQPSTVEILASWYDLLHQSHIALHDMTRYDPDKTLSVHIDVTGKLDGDEVRVFTALDPVRTARLHALMRGHDSIAIGVGTLCSIEAP